jgi:hypothetical protein
MMDDGAGSPLTENDIELQLRQMALVDRVLGLEAEVARLTVRAPAWTGPRAEIERLRDELDAVHSSTSWKIGRALVRPVHSLLRLRRPGKANRR